MKLTHALGQLCLCNQLIGRRSAWCTIQDQFKFVVCNWCNSYVNEIHITYKLRVLTDGILYSSDSHRLKATKMSANTIKRVKCDKITPLNHLSAISNKCQILYFQFNRISL